MTTLNEAIAMIQADENARLSADARNALHAATYGHPWCKGKTIEDRKLEVRFAVAGRGVYGRTMQLVERARA